MFKLPRTWTLLPLSTLTAASLIHTLTSSNFTSFLRTHELSFVKFHVPWCVYCQELEPEFESAAARIHDWPLASVDCDAEPELCIQVDIPIYPTLMVFHGVESTSYDGRRTADAMVPFVKRHGHPLITTLASMDDVPAFRSRDQVVVVGYHDEDDTPSRETFAQLARSNRDDFLFASISDPTFGLVETLPKPSITIYKPFDELKSSLHTLALNLSTQQTFLDLHAHPLIGELDHSLSFLSAPLSGHLPVAWIFAETPSERARFALDLLPLANATRGKLSWVTLDPAKHGEIASNAGLREGEWPAFAIQDAESGEKFALPLQGEIGGMDAGTIGGFVEEFLDGRLVPTARSLDAPGGWIGSGVLEVGGGGGFGEGLARSPGLDAGSEVGHNEL